MARVSFNLRPQDGPTVQIVTTTSHGKFICVHLGEDLSLYADSAAQARAIAAALTLAADTIDPPPVGELRLTLAQEVEA